MNRLIPHGEIVDDIKSMYWEYKFAGTIEYIDKTGKIHTNPYYTLLRVCPTYYSDCQILQFKKDGCTW
jgi:hypothetical protein